MLRSNDAPGGQFDRLPPHSIEAEMCFLGSIMLLDDRMAAAMACREIDRDAFFQPDHQIIFDAIKRLIAEGKPTTAMVVREALLARQQLAEIGGAAYLGAILNSVANPASWQPFAESIRFNLSRRRAIAAANDLLRASYGPCDAEGYAQTIAAHTSKIETIRAGANAAETKTVGQAVDAFLANRRAGKSPALLTDCADIDEYAGIFAKGAYTLIGARPSQGKSTFARWLEGNWAEAGTTCGLVAVEENLTKIAGNYLSAWSGIENHVIAYASELSAEDWAGMETAAVRLRKMPIHIVDSAFTAEAVSAAVDKLVMAHGCKVVVVDHIHCIEAKGNDQREKINSLSMALKSGFKRHDVVGIVCAQLRRSEVKTGEPPAPRLDDLKESGNLEADADAVLLIHRKDYYHRGEDSYTPDHLAQFHVAKNRNGRVGIFKLTAELKYQRFAPVTAEAAARETLPQFS